MIFDFDYLLSHAYCKCIFFSVECIVSCNHNLQVIPSTDNEREEQTGSDQVILYHICMDISSTIVFSKRIKTKCPSLSYLRVTY